MNSECCGGTKPESFLNAFYFVVRSGQEKETAQPSSSEPSMPRAAEEEVVQPSNCLRTRVEPDSPEYKDIKKLLGNTPLVINDIEKIVSDDLWEKYKK